MNNYIVKILLALRKLKYSFYSNNSRVKGTFNQYQPVVKRGKGSISFGENVNFGVINSPHFYNGYIYIEARTENSTVVFGNNIHVNNGFSLASEKSITIKDDVLIGFNCHIIDSDFHNLDPLKRKETDPSPQAVLIERNVFIGNNVTILKGVTIGENSVVASGSIVTKSCPANVIVAGSPAKVVNELLAKN
ncbi:acyltransferase [Ulvibacter antarcticus]|uniref:Maltose O-acetyltransferase n=1 Tax=Ulvibacter antarcticus TaxID=442714 RepID=A0A3L9YF66_9FLAO|nr:acyltransferase [Ulvibacter antarcticus]RMA56735.1 maltose O-acetyltransferase [Ulvibacter antarcticus]